jgi:hypothetical protein
MFGFSKNKVVGSNGRGQGDQWPVVLNNYESENFNELLMAIVENGKSIDGKNFSIIKDKSISVVVESTGKVMSAFFDPELYSNPTNITKISVLEWPHKCEADIQGIINEARSSFFAVDYSTNKLLYKNQSNLDIELAGLCSVVDEFDVEKINETSEIKYVKSFTGLFPTPNDSFYTTCFDVINVEKKLLTDEKDFWIIDAKLTNTQNPLIVKLYLPVSSFVIQKGKKYTAPMLLLGRIS